MSEEKRFKARVQHKRKTEKEWRLDVYDAEGNLREDAFKPLKGELIIFAADYSAENPTGYKYDRFKFGDGITNAIDLPFVNAQSTVDPETCALRMSELDKANWVKDKVPQEWIDTEISASEFPYTIKDLGKPRKSKDSGYAYDFGRMYNRVYVECSGDGWGGHGGGQYAKFALTSYPTQVPPDPDYRDWEIVKDESEKITSMTPRAFNESIPTRLPDGHIMVPADASAYTTNTSKFRRNQAISVGYYEDKTAELENNITQKISDIKNQKANAIQTSKEGDLLIIEDADLNADTWLVSGLPGAYVCIHGKNFAQQTEVSVKGNAGYYSDGFGITPLKNRKYIFSADFENYEPSVNVGIAVKPDGSSKTWWKQLNSTKGVTSGTLSFEIEVGDYNNNVALRFYSNSGASTVQSNCKFSNIRFALADMGVEPGVEGYKEQKYVIGEDGTVKISVPTCSPALIYNPDGENLSVEYNKDINKYFATKDEVASNLTNGEVEFSIIQKGDNKVYAKNGTAFGYGSIAGSKGYSLAAATGADGQEGTYTLNVTPDPSILGKTFSIYLKSNRYQTGTVTAINDKVITVDNIFLPTGWDQPDSDGDYPITYGYLYFTDDPTLGDVNIGTGAHTEGYGNKAVLTGAHAEGAYNVAEGKYGHAEGYLTYAGYAGHSEGRNTKALGEHAHSEGHSTQAIGNQSHAQGHSSKAIGVNSTAGGQSAEARGKVTEAVGYYAKAIGDYSSAHGNCVVAIGGGSRIMGSGSAIYHGELTKQAVDAHWAANKNINAATGYNAVNIGTNSLAAGPISTVAGDRTHATGESSMAINRETLASGKFSFAAGQGTKATIEAQAAFGKFNKEDSNALFVVGNGNSSSDPSNALTVNKDGTASIKAGPIKNTDIVNKNYVDTEIKSCTNSINDQAAKLSNCANGITESKTGELLVLDDLNPNTNTITVSGEPDTKIYACSVNLAKSLTIHSKGTTSWKSNYMAIRPPKNQTYTISCDFNKISGTTVGVAIKPDLKSIGGAFEVFSSEASGKLSTTVTIGDYSDAIYVYFYSNYTGVALESECEFTNSSASYTVVDNGVLVKGINYSPVLIYTNSNKNITCQYSKDISKHFTTQEYADNTAAIAESNANKYTDYQIAQISGEAPAPKDSEGLEYTLKNDDTYEVTGIGTCQDLILRIPSTYMGKSVTSIGDNAFYSCMHIISITIPASIISIGQEAFYRCYRLSEVVNNSSLNIKANSTDNGSVALHALRVHSGETEIKIKDNYFFYTLDGFIHYLLGANNIDKELVLPENYNGQSYDIQNYAFYATNVITVVIPDGVRVIGPNAFSSCKYLSNVIIGNRVTHINSQAFYGCSNLAKVTMGSNITRIGDAAFANCQLVDVVIPNGVTYIGTHAFGGNTGTLRKCIIPKTVETIKGNAFSGDGNTTMYCEHESKPNGWESTWADEEAIIVWGVTNSFIEASSEYLKKSEAFSGKYSDLSGKPTIPTALSQLSSSSSYRTVTDTEKTTWNNKLSQVFPNSIQSMSGKVFTPGWWAGYVLVKNTSDNYANKYYSLGTFYIPFSDISNYHACEVSVWNDKLKRRIEIDCKTGNWTPYDENGTAGATTALYAVKIQNN